MVVEELVSVLGLEIGSGALATLDKFVATVQGGLATLAGMGAVAAGAFVGIVASVAHLGDELDMTADQLSMNVTRLQELKYAADQSDVSFGALTTGLKFLSKNAAEAAAGGKEAMEAFAGIELRDGNGKLKSPDELLRSVVEKFQTMPDAVTRTNRAMKLFGRSGTEIMPMLKQGNAQLDKFIDDAYELGVILDEETIAASGRFDQQLKRLRDSIIGLRNDIGAPFVGAFADGMKATVELIKGLRPGIKLLVAAIKDMGARIASTVKNVFEFTKAIKAAFDGSVVARILAGIDGLKLFEASIIGLGAVMVATGLSAAASWLLAVAPFLALSILIGLIIDDVNTFIEGGDSMLGRLQKWAEFMNPDDSPMIRFWKSLVALLMDFTDPKHWARFKQAAKDAIDDIGETIRLKLGGKKFVKDAGGVYHEAFDERGHTGVTTQDGVEGATEPNVGGVFGTGGVLDKLEGMGLIKRAAQPGPSVDFSQPRGIRLTPPPGGLQNQRPVVVQQQNEYHIDASGWDPEVLKRTLREHEDDRNREAAAAIPGVN